jgi:hypothetical protein
MRLTIVSLEGSWNEIRQAEPLIRSIFPAAKEEGQVGIDETARVVQQEPGMLSRLDGFIDSRGRGFPRIDLVRKFVREVASWPGTRPMLGKSSRSADGLTRYLRIHADHSRFGGFVYVYPSNGRLFFRLLAEDVTDVAHAEPNPDREGDYQVNMYLTSEAALEEALGLARQALERARAA